MRPCVMGIVVLISCALVTFGSAEGDVENAPNPGERKEAAIGPEASRTGQLSPNAVTNNRADVTFVDEGDKLLTKEDMTELAEYEVGPSRPNPLIRRMHEKEDSYESRIQSYDHALAQAIKLGIPAAIQHVISSKGYDEEGDFTFIHEPTKIQLPEQPPTPGSKLTTPPQHQPKKEHSFTLIAKRLQHFKKLWPYGLGLKPYEHDFHTALEPHLKNFKDSFDPEKKLRLLTNPGSSSALLYQTHDKRYLIKAGVKSEESALLLKIISNYVTYMADEYRRKQRQPLMLLYFGLFEYQPHVSAPESYKATTMLLMEFIGPPDSLLFDIKGCTRQRYVKEYAKGDAYSYPALTYLVAQNKENSTALQDTSLTCSSTAAATTTIPEAEGCCEEVDDEEEASSVEHVEKLTPPSSPAHNNKAVAATALGRQASKYVHIEDLKEKGSGKRYTFTYRADDENPIPADFSSTSFTYRDLNFKARVHEGLWLHPDDYDLLMDETGLLASDIKELIDWDVMDYSIFLSIRRVDEEAERLKRVAEEEKRKEREQAERLKTIALKKRKEREQAKRLNPIAEEKKRKARERAERLKTIGEEKKRKAKEQAERRVDATTSQTKKTEALQRLKRNEFYAVLNPYVSEQQAAEEKKLAGTLVIVRVALIDFLGKYATEAKIKEGEETLVNTFSSWLPSTKQAEHHLKKTLGLLLPWYYNAAVAPPHEYGPRLTKAAKDYVFKSISQAGEKSELFEKLIELREEERKHAAEELKRSNAKEDKSVYPFSSNEFEKIWEKYDREEQKAKEQAERLKRVAEEKKRKEEQEKAERLKRVAEEKKRKEEQDEAERLKRVAEEEEKKRKAWEQEAERLKQIAEVEKLKEEEEKRAKAEKARTAAITTNADGKTKSFSKKEERIQGWIMKRFDKCLTSCGIGFSGAKRILAKIGTMKEKKGGKNNKAPGVGTEVKGDTDKHLRQVRQRARDEGS